MSLNIGNPSIDRAKAQVKWIEEREEDIFILTETKNSEGCNYIENYFFQYEYNFFSLNPGQKYNVYFPKSKTNDLGVMVVSKFPIKNMFSLFDLENRFHTRIVDVDIEYHNKDVHIIGLYVPSRDRTDEKVQRKKMFLIEVAKHINMLKKSSCVICGDLNILEKNHIPHYSTFFDWEYAFYDYFSKQNFLDAYRYCFPQNNEYSWVGRTNDGYRYDHCFVSNDILPNIKKCFYVHETRNDSLTDHSAIVLHLEF